MSNSAFKPPAVILVAEDDAGDRILIGESLQATKICKRVQMVVDGEEAMDYLYHRGRYAVPAFAPRPDLILLDLNMPRLGGTELLARLKADSERKGIPIVAFTTSGRDEDVSQCYEIGVNSYVQKPTDFDQFQLVLQTLEHYWLEVCRLPPRPAPR